MCGLNFAVNPPSILTNGVMSTGFCNGSTISDTSGNLLFYTNGMTVWNRQHLKMANGTGLSGSISASQEALAIKQPGNNQNYFVFTNYHAGSLNGGFQYSIINMSLSAGLGSVTVKNEPLLTPGCEKVTATRHCNGKDIWVITHELSNDRFLSYLLTAAGLNTVPVISQVGPSYIGIKFGESQLKADPWGQKVVDGVYGVNSPSVMLYDFDNSNGILSNPVCLCISYPGSTEFSADGGKLYSTLLSTVIVQWDLCAGSSSAIVNSMDTIGFSTTSDDFGWLQLAPDQKIYCSRRTNTLSVINEPAQLGSSCNFVEFGQITAGMGATSLPNFPTHLLRSGIVNTPPSGCAIVTFSAPSRACNQSLITGYSWNFNDPVTGSNNTSTLSNPTHVFSTGGNFNVKVVITYSNCSSDTVSKTIYLPMISINGKQSICEQQSSTLTASGASSYTWNSGTQASSIIVSPSITTVYTVTGTFSNSCLGSRVVTISVLPCTALTEASKDLTIELYPNPVTNELNIDCSNDCKIIMYNLMGQIITEVSLNEGQNLFSMNSLPAGIYILRSGQQFFKVLKE
jgi:hypothetical protein